MTTAELRACNRQAAVLNRELAAAEAAGDEPYAAALRFQLATPQRILDSVASERAANPFVPTAAERAEAIRRAASSAITTATRMPRTRARGAGRPRAAAARSSARSGDSGDDGSGEPAPPPKRVQGYARTLGIAIEKVRWCLTCGIVAPAADDYQRCELDRRGFIGGVCPDCWGQA